MTRVRPSGLYAVLGGQEIHVHGHGRGYVTVTGPGGPVRHEMDELDDFLSVKTFATWRGGTIAISAVEGDEAGFFTNDSGLAEREGLAGDTYDGWRGAAALAELTDVDERVTSIHPRRREA
ncbi:hypothetical protein [Nocardioides hwasunensis]|uniref:Uncharacterized protein n=1 Tax=Nocardioides hwasunensis TaxID=397258 RepID=A0ABR8MKW6_9ACTN|nr:hypothetical protein [Nocardioides hwasunensis]MBD3916578.1 hypothetical protein [Nocardioides hwasunensis]